MSALSVKPRAPRRPPRVLCAAHCCACGGHFSSTGAFDLHRQFEKGHHGDWSRRVCVGPEDDKRFGAKSEAGTCVLSNPDRPLSPVTVWAVARGLGANPWAA